LFEPIDLGPVLKQNTSVIIKCKICVEEFVK